MKLVITGVNSEGRSHVVSSKAVADSETAIVWTFEPDHIRKIVENIRAEDAAVSIEPEAGSTHWIHVVIPSGPTPMGTDRQGVDEHGFHTTRTVDFAFVLDGELQLLLDEDTVDLQAGDFVVQQATRHSWRNETGKPARMVVLVHTPA